MTEPLNERVPFAQEAGEDSDIKERFYRYFHGEVTELQDQIGKLESYSLAGGERQDAIDRCLVCISRLSNEVTDASSYIPAYDLRTYGQAVKALGEKLQETRAKFAPKSRFQFKSRGNNSSSLSRTEAAELAAQPRFNPFASRPEIPSSSESPLTTTPGEPRGTVDKNYNEEMEQAGGPIRKPSFSQATNVNISGHTGLHIILPSSASIATVSGSITQMDRCIVDMSVPTANGAPFAGLALKSIKDSLIIAGHVAGAAHITAVENSIIVVASRQVRIHDCKNLDIYLLCTSRPIIEDCTNIRFSPIPEAHTITSEPAQNQWDQIDDFKWLKVEHSPNWSILRTDERLGEDVWSKVVPGGPDVGLEDILEKVGIAKR